MRFWSQLTPRDRVALSIGTAVVLVTALVFGVIAPYRSALSSLDTKIARRQTQVQEVANLGAEYRKLQRQLNEAEGRLSRNQNFSLFTFLEAAVGRVATKENLVYMRPQPPVSKEGYREESVEIKLEKLRLDQLVRFLYAVESAEAWLQVKNLRVRTRFDNKSLLDAVMTVSSYGRAS